MTPVYKQITTGECPDCGQRSRFVVFIYEVGAPRQTCLKCGRRWVDGVREPLPSWAGPGEKAAQGARAHARAYNREQAKAMWRELEHVPVLGVAHE